MTRRPVLPKTGRSICFRQQLLPSTSGSAWILESPVQRLRGGVILLMTRAIERPKMGSMSRFRQQHSSCSSSISSQIRMEFCNRVEHLTGRSGTSIFSGYPRALDVAAFLQCSRHDLLPSKDCPLFWLVFSPVRSEFCNRVEHRACQTRGSECLRCAWLPVPDMVDLLQGGQSEPAQSTVFPLFWSAFFSGQRRVLQ